MKKRGVEADETTFEADFNCLRERESHSKIRGCRISRYAGDERSPPPKDFRRRALSFAEIYRKNYFSSVSSSAVSAISSAPSSIGDASSNFASSAGAETGPT